MQFMKKVLPMNYNELITVTTDVGCLLLANGAEIYRVEESMHRIFCAYGVKSSEIFAIPTCINVTVTTPDGKPVTLIKRIPARTTNLDRVERGNDLCRRICRSTPEVSEVRRELASIEHRPVYGFSFQVLAFALVAFTFTLFYGGSFADGICSMVCGAAIKVICYYMNRVQSNSFFVNIIASCVAAAIALTAAQFNIMLSTDKIIIGALMNLVPGIAITSFMRDIIAGDLMAGIIRFTESMLVATAIAIGAGIALTVTRIIWGV
jgi:uncharacterized membrane protein YjjP (DUF1212 family)